MRASATLAAATSSVSSACSIASALAAGTIAAHALPPASDVQFPEREPRTSSTSSGVRARPSASPWRSVSRPRGQHPAREPLPDLQQHRRVAATWLSCSRSSWSPASPSTAVCAPRSASSRLRRSQRGSRAVHGLYSGPSRRGCGLLLLLTADGLAVAASVSLVELELAAKIRSDERSAAASVSPGYKRVLAPSGGLAGRSTRR
jgi:hypothetical protein